jgi:hypothetical protein
MSCLIINVELKSKFSNQDLLMIKCKFVFNFKNIKFNNFNIRVKIIYFLTLTVLSNFFKIRD